MGSGLIWRDDHCEQRRTLPANMVCMRKLLVVNIVITAAVLVVALALWFRTPVEPPALAKTEQRTRWVEVRDVDGDGWLDINFTNFPLPGFDFDGDGDLDLFVFPNEPNSD